ncbi:MAG: bifunctional adenosylcobinamide kinase/adenosylcobinamide-phosphate guanylyltransferase [Chloroflexota bacterium]
MAGKLTLILGGVRSGKSAYAQKLVEQRNAPVLFVATADIGGDEEMQVRVNAHRVVRPQHWQTLEASRNVGKVVGSLNTQARIILLDCLTVLAGNVVSHLLEPITSQAAELAISNEIDGILATYNIGEMDWFIISNEVGMGIVPPYPLGRVYRDALGRANQRLAAEANEVIFMIAGLPMKLKG